jgi:hypothetical protein
MKGLSVEKKIKLLITNHDAEISVKIKKLVTMIARTMQIFFSLRFQTIKQKFN